MLKSKLLNWESTPFAMFALRTNYLGGILVTLVDVIVKRNQIVLTNLIHH